MECQSRRGIEIARASGAKEAWCGAGGAIPTSHLMGGTIMGSGLAILWSIATVKATKSRISGVADQASFDRGCGRSSDV